MSAADRLANARKREGIAARQHSPENLASLAVRYPQANTLQSRCAPGKRPGKCPHHARRLAELPVKPSLSPSLRLRSLPHTRPSVAPARASHLRRRPAYPPTPCTRLTRTLAPSAPSSHLNPSLALLHPAPAAPVLADFVPTHLPRTPPRASFRNATKRHAIARQRHGGNSRPCHTRPIQPLIRKGERTIPKTRRATFCPQA